MPDRPTSFNVMVKPIGPVCNLACEYCYYLEKESLYDPGHIERISDGMLESYTRQYIEAQSVPEITFSWQGGEPTLLGAGFFRRAVELQKKYAGGKTITNSLQTNATALNDDLCAVFAENKFLLGVSIDGPREIHNRYRLDKQGNPTFDRVMDGIALLRKHGVEYNALTVVGRHNARHPLNVYRFLKETGFEFMQFIPLVERAPDAHAKAIGLDLAEPPELRAKEERLPVTPWTVEPFVYGSFLTSIFDEWVREDVGKTFVQHFDVALGNWLHCGPGLCIYAERCGTALVLEHNGDLYACDHYVYPEYRLGNIADKPLADMVFSDAQSKFGMDKFATLPGQCMRCPVRFACNGGCTKHRFATTPEGEPGLSYLCAGYKHFFTHITPFMDAMARLLNNGQPASMIMDMIRKQEERARWQHVKRNDPCPCGSGKKYKQCCGLKQAAEDSASEPGQTPS
ncbi:anaerobic sulfatase-maturation protein [bacterium]|nr:anaerobic sulfatase-maturation protein [bacterium]